MAESNAEKLLKETEQIVVDPDANAMIADRKKEEVRLQVLINEGNQWKAKYEQLKKEQEVALMEMDRRQGAINEVKRFLANNPVRNASSLQTRVEGETPK